MWGPPVEAQLSFPLWGQALKEHILKGQILLPLFSEEKGIFANLATVQSKSDRTGLFFTIARDNPCLKPSFSWTC